jgi:CxxC-x17-CxxC domain-containing protein
MGNFNRDSSSRGGHRGGFGRSSYSRDRNDYGRNKKQMFNAVCSNCGKNCEVPFKPTGEKPVYCSDCFEKMGGKSSRNTFDRTAGKDRSYSDDKYKIQFESLNTKLDKIIELLQPKNIVEDLPLPVPAVKVIKTKKSKPKTTKTEKPKKKTAKAS